jgi:hypothetical protein
VFKKELLIKVMEERINIENYIKYMAPLVCFNNPNYNGRIYSMPHDISGSQYSFDLGEQILYYKKAPTTIDQYFEDTKYNAISFNKSEIPNIKLNIKLRRNPYEKEK